MAYTTNTQCMIVSTYTDLSLSNNSYRPTHLKIPTTVIHSTYVIQFFLFYVTDPALLLQSDAARRFVAGRRNAVSPSIAPRPLRPSPTTYPLQPTFLHHIRKFLRSSLRKNAVPFVRNDKLHDPLDVRLLPCFFCRGHHDCPAGSRNIAPISRRLHARRN
jgi:hypothetical protein